MRLPRVYPGSLTLSVYAGASEEVPVLFEPDKSVTYLIARFDVHVETDRGH